MSNNNSRNEHNYQHLESNETNVSSNKETSRVNTPANATNTCKPAFSPTNSDNQNSNNDRMVSPKRKVEHFQHLYVANNVKTSSFNEQSEKNNLTSTKNNLNSSHDYTSSKYNCSHSSINMVPERDTGPNKISSVNAVGNLKISTNQNGSKFNGDLNGNDDHRMVTSRAHHHVSVQELRMQQRAQHCNSSSDENRSSGHASMSDTGNSSPRGVSNGTDRLNAGVTQKSIRNRSNTQHNRSRHRATPARVYNLCTIIYKNFD